MQDGPPVAKQRNPEIHHRYAFDGNKAHMQVVVFGGQL
jgi:hypothetical protein